MRSGSAPAWARDLVLSVCAQADVAPPAVLRWRRARREASTGLANRHAGSIAVTAGGDEADARHTLLHELGHWIAPGERRAGGRSRRPRAVHHGRSFYRVVFELYRRHGPSFADGLAREAARYPSALRHAVALGMPDAARILAERRTAGSRNRRTRATWRVLVPEHPVELARDGRWYVCATCGRRVVGRTLVRVAHRGRRERHVLWTREPVEASA